MIHHLGESIHSSSNSPGSIHKSKEDVAVHSPQDTFSIQWK